MPGKTYKQITVTGTSADSIEDAVNGAVATASKTIRHMRWFEVVERAARCRTARCQSGR